MITKPVTALLVSLIAGLCAPAFAHGPDRVPCRAYEKLTLVPLEKQSRLLSALSEKRVSDETENTDDFTRFDGGDRRFGWNLEVAPVDFECRSEETEYRGRKGRFVSLTSVWVELESSEQQNVVGTSAQTVAFVDRDGRMIDFSDEKNREELLCVGSSRPKLGADAILPKGNLRSPQEKAGSWFKKIDRFTGLHFVYPDSIPLKKRVTAFDAALTMNMSYTALIYNLSKTAYPLREIIDPASTFAKSLPLSCRVIAMPHRLDGKLSLIF